MTLGTIVRQAPLSMEFSRQEYWSGLPFPSGDLPNPVTEPTSLTSPALTGGFFTNAPLGKPLTAAATAKSLQSCPPHPWDSPGKNTGVGCHFLLQCIKVKSKSEVAQSSLTLRHPMDCSLPVSSVHGIFQARVLEWGAIAFSEAPDYQLPNATGDLGCLHICPSSLLLCSG